MAGGMDQAMATKVLSLLCKNSGGPTVSGTVNVRLINNTTASSDTVNGSELSTSGGYTAGGQSVAFAAASAGTISTNAADTWMNMPVVSSLVGVEEWDTSGTPLRLFWATFGTPISVASGNTFQIASGNLTNTLA